MAGGFFTRLMSSVSNARVPARPYSEQGVAGFTASGGYIVTPEKSAELAGPNRWHTAQDLLSNISIIAASVRYSLNLISRPAWRADPPSDKQEAKDLAEFVEEVINGADTSWARIIRRSAVYRYHGFNLQEWVAKKRDDGKIGIASIEQRPAHTVRKWDLDENGGVMGVVQASPQTGQEVYLPRAKLVYLVDDALTDNPEGMGWFRHLADPAQRLKRYLKLETMGFERDLAGIPVGRAPLQRINQLVADNKLTRKEADKMVKSLEDFVRMAAKQPETGLLLDSEPFRAKTETGETFSSVMQWGLELLTGSPGSMADLGNAIHRLMLDMAMIIGTDSMLIGQSSGGKSGGSRALSEDKSKNLYLTSNAALSDMAEAYDRDVITPIWVMNGFPDELRPRLKTEDVSFKDAEGIAAALAAMAQAGAILHPNDPAVNDLRDLMGIEHAPPVDDATAELMLGAKAGIPQVDPNADPNGDGGGSGGGGSSGGRPSRENPGENGAPARGKQPTKKFDEDQPRDDHGRWTNGDMGVTVKPFSSDHPALTGFTHEIEVDGQQKDLAASEAQAIHRANLIRDARAHRILQDVTPEGGHTMMDADAAAALATMHGEGRNSHGSLMGAKALELVAKYDPSEPRDEIGRWTDGGGGTVVPLTRELKNQLLEPNRGKDVDTMRAEATVNQKLLDGVGATLEEKGLASYEPPPPGYEIKTKDSVMRKIRDEGYDGPHAITDYSRASFVIDHPHEADAVIGELQKQGTVYDKGWQYLQKSGYLDRKVYMQWKNGGLSEIQITPRGVFQVKMGHGHKLYEIARQKSTAREVADAALRKSRHLYKKVIAGTRFAALL